MKKTFIAGEGVQLRDIDALKVAMDEEHSTDFQVRIDIIKYDPLTKKHTIGIILEDK